MTRSHKPHVIAARRPVTPAHAYFGVQVRNARCCEHLKQNEAAQLLGFSQRQLHLIEVGDVTVTDAETVQILEAFSSVIDNEECARWLREIWKSPLPDRPEIEGDEPESLEITGYWQVSTKDGTVTAYATEEAALASLDAHVEFVPFGVTR